MQPFVIFYTVITHALRKTKNKRSTHRYGQSFMTLTGKITYEFSQELIGFFEIAKILKCVDRKRFITTPNVPNKMDKNNLVKKSENQK